MVPPPVDTKWGYAIQLAQGKLRKRGRTGRRELPAEFLKVPECVVHTAPQPTPWMSTQRLSQAHLSSVGTPKRLGPTAGIPDRSPLRQLYGVSRIARFGPHPFWLFKKPRRICLWDNCRSSPNRCSPAAFSGYSCTPAK